MPLVDNRTEQLINASQGNADLAGCIALCLDCATLCQACIPPHARGSQFST